MPAVRPPQDSNGFDLRGPDRYVVCDNEMPVLGSFPRWGLKEKSVVVGASVLGKSGGPWKLITSITSLHREGTVTGCPCWETALAVSLIRNDTVTSNLSSLFDTLNPTC